MRKTILAILVSAATGVAAQPGTVNMTPVRSFNLRSVPVEVPAKYQAAIGNYSVMLPQGYKAKIFYAGGLMKPRFMAFAPNGVLHVSDMTSATGQGKVYALPDLNDDGEADTIIAVAGGFTNNHDVKFYKNNMYVTETFKVWRHRDGGQ